MSANNLFLNKNKFNKYATLGDDVVSDDSGHHMNVLYVSQRFSFPFFGKLQSSGSDGSDGSSRCCCCFLILFL